MPKIPPASADAPASHICRELIELERRLHNLACYMREHQISAHELYAASASIMVTRKYYESILWNVTLNV